MSQYSWQLCLLFNLLLIYVTSSRKIIIPDDISYSRPNLKTIGWMHIQKTSSWIGMLLAVWACPDYCRLVYNKMTSIEPSEPDENNESRSIGNYFDQFDKLYTISSNNRQNMPMKSYIMNCSVNFNSFDYGFSWHAPYMNPAMNHSLVTLFRKPTSRLISAYLFGIMLPAGFPDEIRSNHHKELKETIMNSTNPIVAYAKLPGIISCQTKMVLGYFCGENVKLTNKDIKEAKRRIREDFYFFGLTEEPEASANLFLAMHHDDGGMPKRKTLEELTDPPFRFSDVRHNSGHTKDSHAKILADLKESNWKDEFDESLYLEVSTIFYERCKQFSIKTKFATINELYAEMHR